MGRGGERRVKGAKRQLAVHRPCAGLMAATTEGAPPDGAAGDSQGALKPAVVAALPASCRSARTRRDSTASGW